MLPQVVVSAQRKAVSCSALLASGGIRLVPQLILHGRQDFLLARFFGDVELGDGETGEPHVRDDRAALHSTC